MVSKTFIASLLVSAAAAARPQIQLFSDRACPAGGETFTFGPIPSDGCQSFPITQSFGAKVNGAVPAGCTYRFFSNNDCSSPNNNFVDITSASTPNNCFHVVTGQPVGSVRLIGGNACV